MPSNTNHEGSREHRRRKTAKPKEKEKTASTTLRANSATEVATTSTCKNTHDAKHKKRAVATSTRAQTRQFIRSLLDRIRAIPIAGRPVPKKRNINALGRELKMRLASTSRAFLEKGRRGGRVTVTPLDQVYRHVPSWAITPEQDPVLLCHRKIKVSFSSSNTRQIKSR